MLYKEWIDFIIFPTKPNQVSNREQRIDISNAIRYKSAEYENHELVKERGFVYTKDQIIFDDDLFEAMLISDYGEVFIWTHKRVWTLYRRLDGVEKLIYLPRNSDLLEFS